jgi:hypothetical protein
VATARELDGVDPDSLVTIGASIGSDGAVDACTSGCLGALALSPGSYLGVPFADAVVMVSNEDSPKPVWCAAAEGDGESAQTCSGASGTAYRTFIYEGGAHGMMLIQPSMDPDVLELVLEFVDLALGG